MRRATSFQPLAGIAVGIDALRSRSASKADDWPDGRSSTARCTRGFLVPSDRVTPTTLRSAAAAMAQRGVRRASSRIAAKPIELPHAQGRSFQGISLATARGTVSSVRASAIREQGCGRRVSLRWLGVCWLGVFCLPLRTMMLPLLGSYRSLAFKPEAGAAVPDLVHHLWTGITSMQSFNRNF
jgi:hypothetical protein